MTLHKHRSVQWNLKLVHQIVHSFLFRFPAAIGEKYERDPLRLEKGESFTGARDRIGAAEKYAIYAVRSFMLA